MKFYLYTLTRLEKRTDWLTEMDEEVEIVVQTKFWTIAQTISVSVMLVMMVNIISLILTKVITLQASSKKNSIYTV